MVSEFVYNVVYFGFDCFLVGCKCKDLFWSFFGGLVYFVIGSCVCYGCMFFSWVERKKMNFFDFFLCIFNVWKYCINCKVYRILIYRRILLCMG